MSAIVPEPTLTIRPAPAPPRWRCAERRRVGVDVRVLVAERDVAGMPAQRAGDRGLDLAVRPRHLAAVGEQGDSRPGGDLGDDVGEAVEDAGAEQQPAEPEWGAA